MQHSRVMQALLPPDSSRDNTTLDPSSDMLRVEAVKWLFLGGRDSPFLHCSKDLQTVKEQAWNMGEHRVIGRVQIKGALDRDDVIDLSTHGAQVRFFEKLRPSKIYPTWVEALTNGLNQKVVLLKWRGFVPLSAMTVIYDTSSSGWNKVSGHNIVQWLTSSFSQRHLLQTALCR